MANSLTFVFLIATIHFSIASNGGEFENLFCEPRPEVVATSSFTYPYYVSLHRCNGSFLLSPPALVTCLPSTEEIVNVRTFDMLRRSRGSIMLSNHTKCKPACVAKESDCRKPNVFRNCRCQCPHRLPPANIDCGPTKSWSSTSCNCVCNKWTDCPSRRYFDEKTCSCKCKESRKEKCESQGGVFKYENCGCRRKKFEKSTRKEGLLENNSPFWISMLFAELIIMVLVFEAFLYYKNHGVIYALSKKCSKKPTASSAPLGKENVYQTSHEEIYFSTDDILAFTEKLKLNK